MQLLLDGHRSLEMKLLQGILSLTGTKVPVIELLSGEKNEGLYTVSQKVPTYKLSVTRSNLNQFLNVLHCWKACEICYNIYTTDPPRLKHVATLSWEIKNSNFLQTFSRYGKNAKSCIFGAPILISLHVSLCMLSVFMCFFNQNFVLVAEYHVDCWQT